MIEEKLKAEVARYWNQASCGTEHVQEEKFSKEYFEKIEAHRYAVEPEIFSFAQFTRFAGLNVLEVGIGAGTDFLQWARSGAKAHGIDLTQEAIDNVRHRLDLYGLNADIRIADAENLPFESNSFDLVYSWGVIHHSPNTQKCLEEIVRVAKPGGSIKIMIYNRHSLVVFYRYLKTALFKGKPFRSFSNVLFYDVESLGTKGYTLRETRAMLKKLPVKIESLKSTATSHDLLKAKSKFAQFFAYIAASIFGWNRVGFYMTMELKKVGTH
ncbi:MAG: class I SAM-dependent methyltransferase [Parachlamydiales bacterium]|nr:class I SAM-dependent methyltransferase [Parachlamydiales bacterium]